MVEKAILRYRRDLSKILRFVSVEVGASQGTKQQVLLDNVSSGINANSLSYHNAENIRHSGSSE